MKIFFRFIYFDLIDFRVLKSFLTLSSPPLPPGIPIFRHLHTYTNQDERTHTVAVVNLRQKSLDVNEY